MRNKEDFNKKDLLKPEIMLRLYANGAFPMADDLTGEIDWFMPEIRTIIPLSDFNYPRSLRQALSKINFEIRYDTDFLSVVRGCSDRKRTWISEELIEAYLRLEKMGFMHTVETYLDNELVGGLYGVAFKGAFFGESMFSRVSQASKAALISLVNHLNEKNFALLDVQYLTPHLKMFGAKEISFTDYNNLLQKAYARNCFF